MLITRECDYGVRILRALSKASIISVQTISSEELIPVQYTYKICRKLSKAGLITSHRGAMGGYTLSADLDKTTLFDVFQVIDSGLKISDCIQEGRQCLRNPKDRPCKVHQEFERLQALINNELMAKPLSVLF